MSKKRVDGVCVIVCDWKDPETGKFCNLGLDDAPKMFVDPDGGRGEDNHYQCGIHHDIVKQEDRPEYQLPEGQSLADSVLLRDELTDPDKDIRVKLDGFKPDLKGKVWEGKDD